MSDQAAYQLQITFGDDMLDKGFTSVPNLFLLNYKDLGLSDGQAVWVIHILRFKWSEKDPYPSQRKLPMKSNSDTRRKFARTLRRRGLLFTRRRYYTPEDVSELGIAPDQVGKLRSLDYDFASLFHNIVRMQRWKAGRRPVRQFEIEIPGEVVEKAARGYYQDTPPSIHLLCEKHIVAQDRVGGSNEPLLLCEKRIVEAKSELEGGATVRKTHSSQPPLLCEKRIVEAGDEPDEGATMRKTHSSEPELLCDFQVVEKRIGNKTQTNKHTHSVVVAAAAATAGSDFDQDACDALLSIGFTPPEAAQQYAASHPAQTIIAWCEAMRWPEYASLANPAGYVRTRLDEGTSPPIPAGSQAAIPRRRGAQATPPDGQAVQATAGNAPEADPIRSQAAIPRRRGAEATPPGDQAAQATAGNAPKADPTGSQAAQATPPGDQAAQATTGNASDQTSPNGSQAAEATPPGDQAAQATAGNAPKADPTGSQAAQATPPGDQAAQATAGNGMAGAEEWTARLRAVTARKAAERRRQWVAILAQMFADAFGSPPDDSPRRRLGRLVKQAGGGLDGALAVAEAIRQAGGQDFKGPDTPSPMDEVKRLVGEVVGQAGRQLGSSEAAGQGDLLPNDGGRSERSPPNESGPDRTGLLAGSKETTGKSDVLPDDGAFPWPAVLEWYGHLADKLPPALRELSRGQEEVLALRIAEVETHRRGMLGGAPGADVGGDGWIVAGLQEMVTCGVREFRSPLVYLQRIVDRWKREGFKYDGRETGAQAGYGGQERAANLTNCPGCEASCHPSRLCQGCSRCATCCVCPTVDPVARIAGWIWETALGELQLQMTRETFNTWLKPTQVVSFEDDVLTIGVENEHVRVWLSKRLLVTVERTVRSITAEGRVRDWVSEMVRPLEHGADAEQALLDAARDYADGVREVKFVVLAGREKETA